jgi:hypothetical protein
MHLLRLFRWLNQPPLNEPKGLYRIFKVGVLLIFIGALSTVLVGLEQGLWHFDRVPTFRSWSRCQAQQVDRQNREQALVGPREVSNTRLTMLNEALVDPHNQSYAEARTAIGIEEKRLAEIDRKSEALKVSTLKQFLPTFIVSLVLSVLFTLIVARLVARQGLAASGTWSRTGKPVSWHKLYWTAVGIIFGAHVAREIFTSIIQTKSKTWFAWSSFCISSEAWALMLVAAFGVAMVVAYPLTMLWHFGSDSMRPVTLDPTNKDGRWGVGGYLLFLQTWATLSLVFSVLPVALWLRSVRNDARISRTYLLTSTVLFVSGLVISGRMVRNAIAIRTTYQTQVSEMGATWQQIQEKKLPPDPTINFLGEHWWKLPTVILGMFAFLWLILEQVGVADYFVELTGMK